MAEVKIISGGSFNVEPQGPLWQGALPDCVPPPNPEIPFEKYREFLVPFKNGEISPLAVGQDDNSTGQTVVSGAPDGGTSFNAVLPSPGSGTKYTIFGPAIVDLSKDGAKFCIKLKTVTPAAPGLSALVAFVFTSSNQLLGFIYDSGPGQFFLFAQDGPSGFATPLAPYAAGVEYEFELTSRPLSPSGQCLNIVARQNGVVVASLTQPSPINFLFPMNTAFHMEAGALTPSNFEMIARELSVGYQPLAKPVGSCP